MTSMSAGRTFKRQATSWLARLARRPKITADEMLALRPKSILIVRQHNQMGDMVCATPAFRAIRETWPDAEIALVTAPVNRGIVAHNPHLDRIFTFDRSVWQRPLRLTKFVSELRGFQPDLAFVLSSVSFSVTSAWLAAASGARYIVGADSRPFGWDVSRHFFSLEMPAKPELDCHAVIHSLAPLKAVGVTTTDAFPVVVPAPAEVAAAKKILVDLNFEAGFWAVHPGAGKRQNVWPASGFSEIVLRARKAGHQVLILHGPADVEPLAELVRILDSNLGEGLQVAPPCELGVGAALLQMADRFVCNDTGIMHMAGAVRVPTVALFGPTDPELWRPPAPEVTVIKSPRQSDVPNQGGFGGDEYGWMENISSDEVWQAWLALPGRTKTAKEG
ncbi:MAG: ADP-heptose:LPS heptosyltransferase [Candidatus Krumholzibacteriia bacterium]|jgi:ADP-heptose:LPS heptosyltransferase